MRLINRKYYTLIFSACVAFLMSVFMSFFLTAVNIGFTSSFVVVWLRSLAVGFAVALPVSFVVIPFVRRLIDPLFMDEK